MSLNKMPVEEIVKTLSVHYKFDCDEAMRILLNKEDVVSKKKELKKKESNKAKVVLPFCGEVNEEICFGVKKNHSLFTQCRNNKESGKDLCKTCGKKDLPFGTIQERNVVTKEEFESAYKVKIANYGNVMQKLKIEKEDALKEAERLGLTIPEEQFEVTKSNRGRPKKSVIVSDSDEEEKPKKSRGRPKKEKKLVSSLNPGDDLIASLVKEAEEESNASSSEDEVKVETPPPSPKKKRAPKKSKEEKEAEKEEKRLKKEQEKKEKAEKKEQEKKGKGRGEEVTKGTRKGRKKVEKRARKEGKGGGEEVAKGGRKESRKG